MVDDASTAAKGREREMQKGKKTTGDYGLHHRILPQELEYMQRGPEEIYSREVHEANGDF